MGEVRFDAPMSCPVPDVASESAITFRLGDTLQNIADCHNVDLKDLMAANGITDPNAIFPGREIKIPQKSYPSAEPSPTNTPQKPASTPISGSVDAKSAIELKFRQATIDGLVHKASSLGIGPGEVAVIASLATRALSGADFNRATSAVQQALSSATPKEALAKLGP